MRFEPPRELRYLASSRRTAPGCWSAKHCTTSRHGQRNLTLHIEIEHGMVIATLQEWYAQHHPRVPRHPGHAVEEPFAAPCRR